MARKSFGAFGKITREAAYGAVVTGIECGSYSSFYVHGDWEAAWRAGLDRDEGDAFAKIRLQDRYEVEEGNPEEAQEALLTDAAIQRGFEVLLQKYPRAYAELAEENGDAISGDALLQCVVLGDVVYG
jgi:hypothetical protein